MKFIALIPDLYTYFISCHDWVGWKNLGFGKTVKMNFLNSYDCLIF